MLSANTTAPFSVESVMDDIDVSSQLSREELEELVEPLLKRVTYPITNALAQAKLTVNDIDFVEIIGGTTRIPVLKKSISDVFGKPLSSTLNQDEAVAKGAAFICAIHSPTLRVRPFKFEDIDRSFLKTPYETAAAVTSLTILTGFNPAILAASAML